jgi:hypothetical protein
MFRVLSRLLSLSACLCMFVIDVHLQMVLDDEDGPSVPRTLYPHFCLKRVVGFRWAWVSDR